MDFSSLLSNVQRSASAAQRRHNSDNKQPQPGFPSLQYQRNMRRPYSYNDSHPPRKRQQHSNLRLRFNEHEMKEALSSLRRDTNEPAPPETSDEQQFHLALLFITIDELPYEHIWNEWVNQATDNNVQVSIIAHAKFPNQIKSPWLQAKLLVEPPQQGRGKEYAPPKYHSRSPEWGSIEITRAMLDLIHEGLKVGVIGQNHDARFSTNRYTVGGPPTQPVNAFVFVSETCLPVVSLKQFCASIEPNTSWVNYRNTPNNGYSRQLQFDKIHPCISENYKHKGDQWCLLSRRHAMKLMDIDSHLPAPFWQCFLDTKASDEMYIPTCLSMLGVLNHQIEQKRITYCDWSESAKNPVTFSNGKVDFEKVVKLSRREGCLFARKFSLAAFQSTELTGTLTLEDWAEAIL
jgi:Core-2/I-Branching enzyme